jgi:hypothetical protein
MVTVAGWLNEAKRNTIGRSPWFCATSGATNQNKVSSCAHALNWMKNNKKKIQNFIAMGVYAFKLGT